MRRGTPQPPGRTPHKAPQGRCGVPAARTSLPKPGRPPRADRPRGRQTNSEEQAREGASGLGDPRVPGREDLEQADQVLPDLVPVLATGPADDAEQPVE